MNFLIIVRTFDRFYRSSNLFTKNWKKQKLNFYPFHQTVIPTIPSLCAASLLGPYLVFLKISSKNVSQVCTTFSPLLESRHHHHEQQQRSDAIEAPKKCCPKNHVLRRENIGGGDDLVCESVSTWKGKHLKAAAKAKEKEKNMGFLPEKILTFRDEYGEQGVAL